MKFLWWILLVCIVGDIALIIYTANEHQTQNLGISIVLGIILFILFRGLDGKINTDEWFG